MAAALPPPLSRRLPRALLSLALAGVLALSLYQHTLNIWGLGIARIAALLLLVVPLSAPVYFLLGWLAARLERIPPLRWALFAVSALLVGVALAWQFYTPPVSWHQLAIAPGAPGLQLVELKNASGSIVPFADLDLPPGWRIAGDLLISGGPQPALTYAFLGPAGRPVRLLFATSPRGGQVQVRLDGGSAALDLTGSDQGQRELTLPTRYRNLPASLTLALTGGLDALAFALLALLLWLVAEIAQQRAPLPAQAGRNPGWWPAHRAHLLILLALALLLHTLNALAVPLILDVDSPSYLRGAVHWLQTGRLDGVSPQRGPGTTFLFAPILAIWGRNPWGMKVLLHLFGIGCVPLAYAIGWQLSRRRWFAFAAGLLALLTPDLMFYANYVMSDLPNVFFSLLFLWLLLAALQAPSGRRFAWQLGMLLTGSFAVLLRSENTALLAAGAGFIGLQWLLETLQSRPPARRWLGAGAQMALACLLAALPLLGWSLHNARSNGFFGLSNTSSAVLYDGWIFYGESIRQPITDPDSPAVQAILAAYAGRGDGPAFAGNTWDDYAVLTGSGYTSAQAYALMQQAALDSIRKDPQASLRLLSRKIQDGLRPVVTAVKTYALPGETADSGRVKPAYFDAEQVQIPALIRAQRALFQALDAAYKRVYGAWVWLCVAALLMGLFRKPFFVWAPLLAVVLLKVFFPISYGFGMWRYPVSGLVPLELYALAAFQSILALVSRPKAAPRTLRNG